MSNFVELEQHPDYCEHCHLIGGYCGNCHGGYWSLKVDHYVLVQSGNRTVLPASEYVGKYKLMQLKGECILIPMYKV